MRTSALKTGALEGRSGRVSGKTRPAFGPFPAGAFVFVIAVVCLGLALSALYGFVTLSRLRTEYLENRGADIASAFDLQSRGGGRRNNILFWQELFRTSYAGYRDTVAFFALVDGSGRVLTGQGADSASVSPGYGRIGADRVYVYSTPLSTGRGPRPWMGRQTEGWQLRVGLYASSADFIRWQAIVHLVVTGIAIATLLALSYYFLRTLRRFLELKQREESARHLAALGAMGATLAHEIRNPLGAMKGLTQLVQEEIPKDHRAQEKMMTVVAEAERLEKLVNDLLTFARPREPRISRFDFLNLVAGIEYELEPKLQSAGISFVVESDPGPAEIRSDEGGLRQVLWNVLINAMDATPSGRGIVLRVRCAAKPPRLIVEVDDGGPGIGPRNSEELFEPFATTKTHGTGLGLPVSRQIIERLGGEITLADRPEGGARCTIELPA